MKANYSKFKEWRERALKFAAPAQWAEIRRHTPEHKAWNDYFRLLGWSPWGLRQLDSGELNIIIMPSLMPQQFDKTLKIVPPGNNTL